MSKFKSCVEASNHLGGLIHVPRHGIVVLHSVRRDGMLEAPEGYYVKLSDCSPVEVVDADVDAKSEVSGDFESGRSVGYAEGFEAAANSLGSESGRDGLSCGRELTREEVEARRQFISSAYNDGYEKGYADGKDVVLNGTAILEPKSDAIAESNLGPVVQDAQGLEGSEGSESSEPSGANFGDL